LSIIKGKFTKTFSPLKQIFKHLWLIPIFPGEATEISVSEVEESGEDLESSITSFETKEMSESEQLKQKLDFNIEDFLNPKSSSIKRLIEHHVIKNPNLLSEMLSMRFSDLLNVFQVCSDFPPFESCV